MLKLVIGLIIFIFIMVIYATNSIQVVNLESNKYPNEIDAKFGLNTIWCSEFKHADSNNWVNLGCVHNVLTDAGKEHIEGLLGGTVSSGEHTKYLALGNGTAPTSSSTTLNSEITDCGLNRVLGTYYNLGTGNWEINTTFTYSCSFNKVVNTTASFNATSGGTLLAGGTITPITFTTNGDQLRLRHIYTLSEG